MRNMGMFSYELPEFTWEHFYVHGLPRVDKKLYKNFDLIFMEDVTQGTKFLGSGPPIIYYSIDSTLTDRHYQVRLEQAKQADLVLVDHDEPGRFATGKPVLPFPYCVNDKLFTPLEKKLDVSFHCSGGGKYGHPGGDERALVRQILGSIAGKNHYTYRSGGVGLSEYAINMGQSKIVVNWPRTTRNLPHRVFDTMACGACLVTAPIPHVIGDNIERGKDYVGFDDPKDLEYIIPDLLRNNLWSAPAKLGHEKVMKKHTWAVRAKQLRELVAKEFGI